MANALRLAEAVPLGYAFVIEVAEQAGVRALAIKGPLLAMQGLRAETVSVDIDVLVEPSGFNQLRAALESVGWHDGGDYDTPDILPTHSVNHRHAMWPLELDLHHWFPGFLADPGLVFDLLWGRRVTLSLANRQVPTLDPVAHGALAALHYLRDTGFDWGRTRINELIGTVTGSWSADDVKDVAELSAATGASEPLRPFLEALGAEVRPPTSPLVVPVADWHMRANSETKEVLRWLVGWTRTPWLQRPAFLWRAVWLNERQLDPTVVTNQCVVRARAKRLRRGLRRLPSAVADYRHITRK